MNICIIHHSHVINVTSSKCCHICNMPYFILFYMVHYKPLLNHLESSSLLLHGVASRQCCGIGLTLVSAAFGSASQIREATATKATALRVSSLLPCLQVRIVIKEHKTYTNLAGKWYGCIFLCVCSGRVSRGL